MSAHLLNLEADGAAMPDQPAEGGDVEETRPRPTHPRRDARPRRVPVARNSRRNRRPTPRRLRPRPLTADEATGRGRLPSADDDATLLGEAAAAPEAAKSKYEGEGVYIGSEPPEGFTIKGNERSMKYHVPESAGYGRTVAEVWFNSEEAAQQAGFVRAQR